MTMVAVAEAVVVAMAVAMAMAMGVAADAVVAAMVVVTMARAVTLVMVMEVVRTLTIARARKEADTVLSATRLTMTLPAAGISRRHLMSMHGGLRPRGGGGRHSSQRGRGSGRGNGSASQDITPKLNALSIEEISDDNPQTEAEISAQAKSLAIQLEAMMNTPKKKSK